MKFPRKKKGHPAILNKPTETHKVRANAGVAYDGKMGRLKNRSILVKRNNYANFISQ